MKLINTLLVAVISAGFVPMAVDGATLAATYEFTNTFNADQSGVAALLPTDPLGQSGFLVDTVFGLSDTVYHFVGNANPATQQSGLSLDTTGLVAPTNYSAELVFKFDSTNVWRRI